MSEFDNQMHARERAKQEAERRGFAEGKLQLLWRTPECFSRTYDMGEVGAAICEALTREGCTAWWGDGTSCVEQMIRLQWDRAVHAEAEVTKLVGDINNVFGPRIRELLAEIDKLRSGAAPQGETE